MISVIIPMYNSEQTIEAALDSIKNQTEFDQILEIIIVNDGSKDGSLKVVEEYASKNKQMPIVIIDKENGGVSTARNSGLKMAKGEYIALLDSDDEWLPDKTKIQMETLRKNPNIDFLGAAVDDKPLRILHRKIDTLYKADVKDICIKCFPQTSAVIFKRNIIDTIGMYDENQKYAEDGNYYLKICCNFNYYYLPVQVVYFGGGKRGFGVSGLSSNLKGMHEGNLKNIWELRQNRIISMKFYVLIYVFYYIKYLRRIIITKVDRYLNP